jgi:NAD(P)-dependent dehydrogenase (short-subunit alcohol dehydrogenase family)
MMNGCRAVVSGGARGIGLAVSQALARSGARVAVLSRSEKAAMDASAALPPIGAGQHHGIYTYMHEPHYYPHTWLLTRAFLHKSCAIARQHYHATHAPPSGLRAFVGDGHGIIFLLMRSNYPTLYQWASRVI